VEETVLGDDLPRVLGQLHEHLHDFGFQADLTRGPGDAVEGRVRAPVADEEGAGHDRSSWSVPRMLAPARAPGDRAKLYISLSHY